MHADKTFNSASGWAILFINICLYAVFIYLLIAGIAAEIPGQIITMSILLVVNIFLSAGFFIINPNEAAALLLFGAYKGTSTQNGFRYANPFLTKMKVSLRARNFNSERLKVNDLTGNPVEIAVVVVWKVRDSAMALFEVDDYEDYVTTQSESAVRHLASSYPYDGPEDSLTLRGATDEINAHLQRELQERLNQAGVTVIEARISHLAYAPEIAGAMLQRQQASAVVAARKKIVEGAVGMVEMALEELNAKELVELDEEKKATMVSNLLVVLCSEHAAQPVVNTGTLYQ